jgi:hypothetical protein
MAWHDALSKKQLKKDAQKNKEDRAAARDRKREYARALESLESSNKYGAKAEVTEAGVRFDSGAERGLYAQLQLEERAGLLSNIRLQQHVHLTLARILYVADFLIFDHALGCDVWCEMKGFETPEWRIKRRLWIHYGPGLLRIYKKDYKTERIFIHEEIKPAA